MNAQQFFHLEMLTNDYCTVMDALSKHMFKPICPLCEFALTHDQDTFGCEEHDRLTGELHALERRSEQIRRCMD
jgi:hypothetical protein